MELFGFYFTWIELIFFAVLFLACCYLLYFYIRYLAGVLRQHKQKNIDKAEYRSDLPAVSIIIAAKNEEDNLRRYLPLILEQDYPEFEVIVVNDASSDETETLCDQYKKMYPNFNCTFVPEGTKNISTKKLALTLGIKAAKYDYLLFTDADCHPQGNTWIRSMVRNFTPGVDLVLGYGAYEEEKGLLNHLITYDTLFIGLQYMGMALAGKPYMGVGRNLAYRKEHFFNQQGFTSHLKLLSGDDDLMVNKSSNKNNTRVETSPEGMTWSIPKKNFRQWFYQKVRHLSVSGHYKTSSKLQVSSEPVARGIFYLAFILSVVFGNIITAFSAVFIFALKLVVQFFIVNRSSRHFNGRKYGFTLLLADIFLPLLNLYILLFCKKKKKNVIWK